MPELNAAGEVRAAGGVVWRRSLAGVVEVLLVHRPKYDDWTLPKGKAEAGESDETCALREVEEETGLACRLERELTEVHYHDSLDRPKVARYWLMLPLGGEFEPHHEIDQVKWVALADAHHLLTYDRDADVLDAVERALGSPVLLIRHADAGDPSAWAGDDRDRPLTDRGLAEAERLLEVLASFPIRQVLTSPARRCAETVAPMAAARGLPVEADDRLAEGAGAAVGSHLSGLLDGGAALCTHGDVIPAVLATIPNGLGEAEPPAAKASTWVLDGIDGCIVRASYLPLPK